MMVRLARMIMFGAIWVDEHCKRLWSVKQVRETIQPCKNALNCAYDPEQHKRAEMSQKSSFGVSVQCRSVCCCHIVRVFGRLLERLTRHICQEKHAQS